MGAYSNIRLYIFIAIMLVLLVLNCLFGWSQMLSEPGSIPVLRNALEQNIVLALLVYIVLTIIGCVVLALPGLLFAICAGVLFGPVYGTMACSFATSAGALVAFLAGRFFLRDSIKPLVMKNSRLRKLLFEESDKNAVFLLLITRLVPIFPYNLQNFAYGITDIKVLPYTVYSFLFMLPGTAVYTVAASGIFDAGHRAEYLLFAGTLFVVTMFAAFVLYRRGCFVEA